MAFPIVASALYISITDIRTHRIPNRSTFLLLLFTLLPPHNSHLALSILGSSMALISMHLLRFGMGDLKLVLVLTLTSWDLLTTRLYVWAAITLATLTVLLQISRGSGRTAFAHILLAPYLLAYLAF
jgi:Flp pilus assembly protein protease CpaA